MPQIYFSLSAYFTLTRKTSFLQCKGLHFFMYINTESSYKQLGDLIGLTHSGKDTLLHSWHLSVAESSTYHYDESCIKYWLRSLTSLQTGEKKNNC